MRLIGIAIALMGYPGCNWTFGLDYVDAAVDTVAVDAATCTMPLVFDRFDTGAPCASWGYPFGLPGPTLAAGDLVLAPDLSRQNNVGCVSQVLFPFGPSGIFVELDAVGTGDAQYNTMILWWDEALTIGTTLQIANGNLSLADRTGTMLGTVHHDPVAMRWLRLRPSDDRSQVIADASPDGRAWTTLGVEVRAAPDAMRAQLQSGTNTATLATAMRVASFDVCP